MAPVNSMIHRSQPKKKRIPTSWSCLPLIVIGLPFTGIVTKAAAGVVAHPGCLVNPQQQTMDQSTNKGSPHSMNMVERFYIIQEDKNVSKSADLCVSRQWTGTQCHLTWQVGADLCPVILGRLDTLWPMMTRKAPSLCLPLRRRRPEAYNALVEKGVGRS